MRGSLAPWPQGRRVRVNESRSKPGPVQELRGRLAAAGCHMGTCLAGPTLLASKQDSGKTPKTLEEEWVPGAFNKQG